MQKDSYILDANAVLRYLLNDDEEQFDIIKSLIQKNKCCTKLEVISEVCYVLNGVYGLSRNQVINVLKRLCSDINVENDDVLLRALEIFDGVPKLDFVDCLLYGYSVAKNENVFTFDKKLDKKIKESKQ